MVGVMSHPGLLLDDRSIAVAIAIAKPRPAHAETGHDRLPANIDDIPHRRANEVPWERGWNCPKLPETMPAREIR